MIVYIKNLLRSIIGVVIVTNCIAQPSQLVIDRDIAEWCLENRAAVKVLHKMLDNRDSVITIKNEIHIQDSTMIESYKQDSITHKQQITLYKGVVENSEEIIEIKDDKIKTLQTNKWIERVISGAVIAVIILLTL